jgi:hypothetical protein
MNGVPIANLALYRMDGGRAVPIPFQIDERDAGGTMALTGPDGKPVNPDDGKWDGNDELVFMARDCGGKAKRSDLSGGCAAVAGIACADPLTGATGWVYLASFPSAVHFAGGRYVSYDRGKDYVTADRYELGYTPGEMKSYFSTLILKDGNNGPSANVLDRFKFRVTLNLFFSMFTVRRTEDDMRSALVGYKDGPIRAIRRCSNTVNIVFRIPSPASVTDNYYYRDSIEWPTLISLPFTVGTVASEGFLTSGCDWSAASAGMRYHNALNPAPVLVDGVMSKEERDLNRGYYAWSAISGPQGAMISRLWLAPSLVMGKELLYIDDKYASDPPESDKGHWGYNGYLFNVITVSRGTHKFISYFYFPENFAPGGEKPYLDILDHPLAVRAAEL